MDPPSKNDEIPHHTSAEASANVPDEIQPSRAENEPRANVDDQTENKFPSPEEFPTPLYTLETQIAPAADAPTLVADDKDMFSDDRIIIKSNTSEKSIQDDPDYIADEEDEDLYSDDRNINSGTSGGSRTRGSTPLPSRSTSPSPERVIESMAPRKPRPASPRWRRLRGPGRPRLTERLREALFVKNAD